MTAVYTYTQYKNLRADGELFSDGAVVLVDDTCLSENPDLHLAVGEVFQIVSPRWD